MPKEFEEMKSGLAKAHPSWAAEKVEEMAAATFSKIFGTNPQNAHKLEESGGWVAYKQANKTYASGPDHERSKESRFEEFMPTFELKEREGEYYINGFLSDPTVDLGNDVIADQKKLVEQVNSGNALTNKLSWRHDWMKKGDGEQAQPVPFGSMHGKAELKENPISKEFAAWAEFKLNKEHPGFKEKLYQIKEGHVSGLSIEYDVLPGGSEKKQLGGTTIRYIKEYRYLGTGVAARPMHPNAVICGFYAKEYEMLDDFAGKGDPTVPAGHSNFGSYDPNGSTAAQKYSELEQFKLDHANEFHRIKAAFNDYSDNQVMAMVKHSHELTHEKTKLTADAEQRQLGGIGMSEKEAELSAQLNAAQKEIAEMKEAMKKKPTKDEEEKKASGEKEFADSVAQLRAEMKEYLASKNSGAVLNAEGAAAESKEMKESKTSPNKLGEFKELVSKSTIVAGQWNTKEAKEVFAAAEELVRANGGLFQID